MSVLRPQANTANGDPSHGFPAWLPAATGVAGRALSRFDPVDQQLQLVERARAAWAAQQ